MLVTDLLISHKLSNLSKNEIHILEAILFILLCDFLHDLFHTEYKNYLRLLKWLNADLSGSISSSLAKYPLFLWLNADLSGSISSSLAKYPLFL